MFTIFNTLTPFYFWLEIGLLSTSGALLSASVIGLCLQAEYATENRLESSSAANSSQHQERAPRAPAEGIIEILDLQGQPTGAGHLVNVSVGGVGFLSKKVLPKGASFLARFRVVQATPPMTVTARVVWLKPLSAGILYGVQYGSIRPHNS